MQHNESSYILLIVTPASLDAEQIQHALKNENFRLFLEKEEQNIVQKSKEIKPDLILLCPYPSEKKNCISIHEIRENSSTRDIPVIFISSIDNESVISECLNYQYTDFIAQPLREKELILRVRHQLSLLKAKRTIRKQNEYLKQTIAARDKLYSVIAHDLRSPIGTIKMINAAIESEKEKITDPGIRQKFEMINETSEEAFNLLENLLRWTRNQNGKTKVSPVIFNLSVAVRQVLSLFTAIAATKNIQLQNNISIPLKVFADEDMIKTILRNLISNAVKYSYPGGKIEISASETNEVIILYVKDNGQGISPENQCKLLKEDQHFTTYGTKNEKGCGLGLLLSRDFVQMNKGELNFTSEEGKGTTFYFTLPKARPST